MNQSQSIFLPLLLATACVQAAPVQFHDLVGVWSMSAAYRLHPDGTRSDDYGPAPRGLLVVLPDGRYCLQIYHTERAPFASPDYRKATAAEYQRAVLTASTHYGSVKLDQERQLLVFHIGAALNPGWDGSVQERPFELKGDTLAWRVPPRANGDTPVSVWKRNP